MSTAAATETRGPAWLSGLLLALPWLLAGLLIALNLRFAAHMGINDDAFITYRVARNLANGVGPVFNPGERVLSVTTPGYMLLLAASAILSQDFVALALLWNGLALLALSGLLIDASRAGFAQPRPRGLASLAAVVAVAVTLGDPLLSAAMGMETPLYLAALLAVFATYRRALQPSERAGRWLLATAAAAAAAFLLRPDGALVGLVVGGHWLITRRRVPWGALAVALVLALPWVLFAWGYYGSPLPNTLAAKISQGLGDRAGQWDQQLLAVGKTWLRANPLAALLALVGAAWVLRPARPAASAGVQVRRLMRLWAALYIVIHVALRARGYYWYYVPLLPVLALLTGDGAAGTIGWLARQVGPWWRIGRPLAVAGLLLGLLWPTVAAVGQLTADEPPGQRQMVYERTGLLLRELCQQPGREPVGMTEIGILGYVSDCRILDFSGLLQPEIAHLQLPAADKIEWAIKSYDPPLVVLVGDALYPFQLVAQPWFAQRYEPQDIQDERGYLSVLNRRALGPMAQRSVAARWWQEAEAGRPVTTTLVFPLQVTPAITLHTFLPADSVLTVNVNGQPLATLAGVESAWLDAPLDLGALGLDTLGLDALGLDTLGLDTLGLDTLGLDTPGLDTLGLDTLGLDTPGLDTPGLDTPGLDTPGLDTLRYSTNDNTTGGGMDGVGVTLELSGQAAGQPAAVAWIESNAVPAFSYFKPYEAAAAQPRPHQQLEQGEGLQATLAPAHAGPVALDVAFRDLPGVQLEVFVDGQLVGVAGSGSGPWQTARFALPAGALVDKATVDIALHNPVQQFVRVYYAALVDPSVPPYVP
jgi:hypothetical protein